MADRIVLMGTKGGPAIYPVSPRMPTSSLVEIGMQRIVIDCGLGVTRGLINAGVRLPDLTHIFITHLHSDHYLELGPLLHTAWTAGLKTPVQVAGPAGLADYWSAFLKSMAFDIETRIADEGRPDLATLVNLNVLDEGHFQIGNFKVHAIRNNHPPITDSFALKIETESKRIVFSGDTAPFEGWEAFVAGADVLVHEAMLGEGVDRLVARVGNGARLKQHLEASHTEVRQVGVLARNAGVRLLALNHLVPSDDPLVSEETWAAAVRSGGYSGELLIGRDGMVIPLA